MKSLRIFLLALVATTTLNMRPALAQTVDPKIEWLTLETPHFIIVYDSKHYWLGQRYAAFAEQAYQALQPIFKEAPKKTTIVVNDTTDIANGFSTQIPYPLIMAYPVLPLVDDQIADYGSWGLELITHEYTHTLNMEPVHGIMKPLSYIFGSIIKPNGLLPRWYLEGLAVNMETRYSHYGRLRSANFLSAARAMVEDGSLRKEDISRINETDIPDWPGGMRPYLLGSLLWSEMIKIGGDKAIYDLNQKYSSRIPGFLNQPALDVLGLDYRELLDETYKDIERMSGAQLKAIDSKARPKETRFTQEGFASTSPSVSPDGTKLVYISQTHNRPSIVEYAERKGNESFASIKPKELFIGDIADDYDSGVERMSWFPDSHGFVFNRYRPVDRYYTYSELWQYDFTTKKKRAITTHDRAHEPILSPDGSWIAFVNNTNDGTEIAAVDADGVDKNFRVLYTPKRQTRVSRPEFLSAGQLVFTERSEDGKEHFKVLNLHTQEAKEVLQAYAPVHFPRMTKKGLFFISDRSGVANIYLWDTQGHVRAVSNSTTRLSAPELDPRTGELLYSRLNGSGSALTSSAESEWQKAAAEPPKVGSLVDYEWPHYDPPHVAFDAKREKYSSWPYLIPRYWVPYLAFDGSGVIVQGTTSMSDPLGKQGYDLAASYDTYVHQPAFYADYLNNETRFPISIAADQYYDAISTGGQSRSNTDALATVSSFIPGFSNLWQAGGGWEFSRTSEGEAHKLRNGPQVYFQFVGFEKKGLEISPEEGGAFRFSHTQFIPDLGDLGYAREDISSQAFLSKKFWPLKWLPDRHVLFLSLNATVEPQLKDTALGVSSLSGYYQTETVNTRYVMRGYDTGAFIGRSFVNGTAEYRFPIHYFYSGFGTKPIFIRRLHGAVFGDVATLDGDYYDSHVGGYFRTRLGRQYFVGTGAELRADLTLYYQMPLTLGLGLYYGTNRNAGPGSPIPYLTVSL